MLTWALYCLIIALVAGMLGLWGLAYGADKALKLVFYLFLVLFLFSLTFGQLIAI